jgi:hypothetical protein
MKKKGFGSHLVPAAAFFVARDSNRAALRNRTIGIVRRG